MRKRFALAASVLALVILVAGACASGSTATTSTAAATAGPNFPITVMVDNGLSGLQAVTVSITRESGGRRLLGPVDSGKKKTFTYDASSGVYQLIARRGAGDTDIVSEKFRVDASATLTWRLPSNTLIQE